MTPYKTAFQTIQDISFPIHSVTQDKEQKGRLYFKVKGSAFFLNNSGQFMTARHVMKDLKPGEKLFYIPPGVKLQFAKDRTPVGCPFLKASWVNSDMDLAVGKVPDVKPDHCAPISETPPELGEMLVSAGFPYADDFRTIKGEPGVFDPIQTKKICYRPGPVVEDAYDDETIDMSNGTKNRINGFLMEAQIFPGMSGGPVVNLEGELVGINLSVITRKVTIPFFDGKDHTSTDLLGAASGIEFIKTAIEAAKVKL